MKTITNYWFKSVIFAVTQLSIFGCINNTETDRSTTPIYVDIDNSIILDLDTREPIELEDTTISVVWHSQLTDSMILLGNTACLKSFSLTDGSCIHEYSMVGRRDDEFINATCVFCADSGIYLYDMSSQKVIEFNLSDERINRIFKLEDNQHQFTRIFPLGDSLFIGRRTAGVGKISELAVYDNEFRWKKDVGKRNLRCGIFIDLPFYYGSDNDVLYYPYFSKNIESIRADGNISTKYQIDWGNYSLPEKDIRKLPENELFPKWGESEDRYVSMVSNIFEDKECLLFSSRSVNNWYLTIHNKDSKESVTYKISSSGQIPRSVISNHDKVFIITSTPDEEKLQLYAFSHCKEIIRLKCDTLPARNLR